MTKLVFLAEATAELSEARDWYEARWPGTGDDLGRAFDDALAAILRAPFAYVRIAGDHRRIRLHRYPYSIIYLPRADDILVISCFHTSREPESWRQRLGR